MKIEEIKNKETGEVMKTKDTNEPLKEYRLEEGDQIVPSYNRVLEKVREAEIKGTTKNITNFLIKCKAREKDGALISDGNEIFLTLTPTQAKTLKKKADEGTELNQTMFTAYKYDSKQYGPQIGVGEQKDFKKPKSFEELDKEKEDKKEA